MGYYAGYYDAETRERVERLFGAVHPIFGSVRNTPEEILKAGIEMGRKARKKRSGG